MSIAKVCKFQKERKEISTDCGETWNPTSEKRKIEGREPVERNSRDCGFQESRETVVSGYTCNGYDKYTQLVDIVSYDGGETWDVISGSSRLGTFVERFSSDCCQLRTVSATVCTELFRKANAEIQEASLDGETWIPTGRYTVSQYLDEYDLDCINEYDIKFLGVPTSGTSGASYFDLNWYKNDICETVTEYDPTCNSTNSNTLLGINDGYVVIACDRSFNASGDSVFCVTDKRLNNTTTDGGFTQDQINTIQNMKYIFIADCADSPIIARGFDEHLMLGSSSAPPYSNVEKIFISSGVTGTLTHNTEWYGNPSLGMTALTEIVGLGDSQITYIDHQMFEGCTSLRNVHLPRTLYCIDLGAFRGCTALTSVTIDGRALRNIESSYTDNYYQQFANCTSLQTVTFPNDYYGVVYKQMFYNCPSLTTVTLGNPSEVRDGAFSGCTSISSIDLGDSVTLIGQNAFADCSSLSDVYIGQTQNILSNVYNSSFPSGCTIHVPCDAYSYWHQAYEVDHPELGIHITKLNMERSLSGTPYCDGVDLYVVVENQISYDCGTNWTTVSTAETLVEANSPLCNTNPKFYVVYSDSTVYSANCSHNTTLSSGETHPSSAMTQAFIGDCVTSIGGLAFYDCSSLTSIDIPDSVISIGQIAFAWCTSLTSVTIGSGVTTIGDSAFDICTSLTSIDIPDSVTSIGSYAFGDCYSLTSCTIGSGLTSIGVAAFSDCSSLTSINIPDGVTSIGMNAFEGCSGLTSCTIGSGVTSIGESAFTNCSSLMSVTIYATTPPTLGYRAFDNTNNCPIYVPSASVNAYKTASGWSSYRERIQAIPPTPPTEIGKFYAEYSGGTSYSAACDGSTELTTGTTWPSGYEKSGMTVAFIGDCITSIGEKAFYACTNLTSVTISSGVTNIGDAAFQNCVRMSSITIPDSVTSIGEGALAVCTSLTSCTIGSGITSIGDNAFTLSEHLTSVTIYATTPPTLGSSVFLAVNSYLIYVPSASVNAYKTASGWSRESNKIRAIPNS